MNGAIEDYTKAIEINPKDADAYKFRGVAKDELGDYFDAILDFNKSIELKPDNSQVYTFRGSSNTKNR